MASANCWDFKKCGRESGGPHVHDLGECSAATAKEADGMNHGVNGGRICWAVSGTLCGGEVQGTFAEKQATCITCEVFSTVRKEEGPEFRMLTLGQK